MTIMLDNIMIFLVALSIMYSVYMYTNIVKEQAEEHKKLEQRLRSISKTQEAILEDAYDRKSTFMEQKEEIKVEDVHNGVIKSVRKIMKDASITTVSMNIFIFNCLLGGGITSAIILYFDFIGGFLGLLVGMFVGMYVVYTGYAVLADKRKTAFLVQFPDAIDMMIRGVKAGLTVNRIMKLVSMEMKDPIAGEYEIISQKMELGVHIDKVLVESAEKLDIEEFRFLAVALVLQMENGGALSDILSNLSGIIRKRLELGLKLKAMSAEARMSAIVISVLPFVFALLMAFMNPAHLKEFIIPGTGQTLLKVAISLFLIGAFIMFKVTKIKV